MFTGAADWVLRLWSRHESQEADVGADQEEERNKGEG